MEQARILYEDNHIIAINKKASWLVQGDKTGDKPLVEMVKEYLKVKYDKPGEVFCGVIHRLDRPVSGVVLFARTSKALARMNEQFKKREVQKTYWAVVKKKPEKPSATLEHYMRKNAKQNKSYAKTKEFPESKKGSLTYEFIKSTDNYHLLEVTPHTGRHHQIRLQLSTIGSPIKGDLKYGFDRSNKDASIHLHARKLQFIHPVKKEEIVIEAAVNEEDAIWRVLKGQ